MHTPNQYSAFGSKKSACPSCSKCQAAMLKWLPAVFVAVLAEPDASCILQTHRNTSELQVDGEGNELKPKFCKQGTQQLDFEGFKHGDKFPPNKIDGVKIIANGARGCTGPLQIIDPKKFNFNAPKVMIYSKAGIPQQCDVGTTKVTFLFSKLQDVELIDLWDLVNGAVVEVFAKNGASLKKFVIPPGQPNNARPLAASS